MKVSAKVIILGSYWDVKLRSKKEDDYLVNADGYCDKTMNLIVVKTNDENDTLGNWEEYMRKVLRHELIHAFLFESGLHEEFMHPGRGHDEAYVDWFAVQMLKIKTAYDCVLAQLEL